MNEDRILREFQRVSISDYLLACHELGRRNIPAALRQEAASLFQFTAGLRTSALRLSVEVRRALELAHDFLWAEHALSLNPVPRYVAYANIRVLDRYLGAGTQLSLDQSLARCGTALSLFVRDWKDYEIAATMAYPERYGRQNFVTPRPAPRLLGSRLGAATPVLGG